MIPVLPVALLARAPEQYHSVHAVGGVEVSDTDSDDDDDGAEDEVDQVTLTACSGREKIVSVVVPVMFCALWNLVVCGNE